jgi:hypothetical protein
MARGCARIGDGDSPLLASRRASCGFERAVELSEYRASGFKESTSGVGQLDTARPALKQLHIELSFDRLDHLTERWLLDAEPFRGPGDVPFLGDCDEIPKMS